MQSAREIQFKITVCLLFVSYLLAFWTSWDARVSEWVADRWNLQICFFFFVESSRWNLTPNWKRSRNVECRNPLEGHRKQAITPCAAYCWNTWNTWNTVKQPAWMERASSCFLLLTGIHSLVFFHNTASNMILALNQQKQSIYSAPLSTLPCWRA